MITILNTSFEHYQVTNLQITKVRKYRQTFNNIKHKIKYVQINDR